MSPIELIWMAVMLSIAAMALGARARRQPPTDRAIDPVWTVSMVMWAGAAGFAVAWLMSH